MFIREKEVNIDDYRMNFLFSLIFAVILPIIHFSSSAISIAFNIILSPFTLIHELGHFIAIVLFLPDQNPQLKLLTLKDGLICGSVTIGGLEICWESLIVLLSGSFAVTLTVIFSILIMRRRSSRIGRCFQKYALFGLLCDLPNLFPIYPTEGTLTDGFRAWLYLHDLINLPYPTPQFSLLFTAITSVIIFYSSFYLGSFLYEIFTTQAVKLHKHQAYPTLT